ncbi:MAG: hypothetical protein J5902_06555 [Paludibacteraceae bacterium]|nr:hypothetical protein [Paludibacteraceae bacterium]
MSNVLLWFMQFAMLLLVQQRLRQQFELELRTTNANANAITHYYSL